MSGRLRKLRTRMTSSWDGLVPKRPFKLASVFICRQRRKGVRLHHCRTEDYWSTHTVDLCHTVWKTSTIFHNCPERGWSLNCRWQCRALSAGNHCGLMQNCTSDWFDSLGFSGLIVWQRCYFRLVWLRSWDTKEFDLEKNKNEILRPNGKIRGEGKSNIESQHWIWVSWQLTDAQLSFIETEQT